MKVYLNVIDDVIGQAKGQIVFIIWNRSFRRAKWPYQVETKPMRRRG